MPIWAEATNVTNATLSIRSVITPDIVLTCKNPASILDFRRDNGQSLRPESFPASRCPSSSGGPELGATAAWFLPKKKKAEVFEEAE